MNEVRSPNDELPDRSRGGQCRGVDRTSTGLGHDPNTRDTIRNPQADFGHVPACPAQDRVAEQTKRRVERWTAKSTPERLSAILAAKAATMRERYRLQAGMLDKVDHRVAEVTDAAGIPVMVRIWYKSYGRAVARVWRVVPSSRQDTEYDIIRYAWTARGLDPAILAGVKAAVIELLDKVYPQTP